MLVAGFICAAAASPLISCGLAGPGAAAPAGATRPTASLTMGGQLDCVAAVPAASAWAVGTSSLGNPQIIRWNGRGWQREPTPGGDRLTSPAGGNLNGVAALSARNAWAVGAGMYNRALIEHWDGKSWTRVPSPDPDGGTILQGVAATSGRSAWAVGGTNDTGKTVIEHWNGVAWTQVPSPSPTGIGSVLSAVAATSASNAWAVGETYIRGGGTAALIEHWDGTAWRQVPSPTTRAGAYLSGVAAISATDGWAVGSSSGGLIERWNGKAWAVVASPALGRFGSLRAVAATSASDAWAVGGTLRPGRGLMTVIEHWNGTAWLRVSSHAAGLLTGVTVTATTSAWAVGFWTASGKVVIEHWNGATWT
jgi:hypothetical protein